MHEASQSDPNSFGLEPDAEWSRTVANDSMVALTQLLVSAQATITAIGEFFEPARKLMDADTDFVVRIQRNLRRHQLCEAAGWLPHYTTPFSLIEDDADTVGLSNALEQYYKRNWLQVRTEFEARLADLNVDGEAKAAFSEGLQAHGHGLYRATPRLLFPEIERIARVQFLNGRLGRIASLAEVREAANGLELSEIVSQAGGGGAVLAQFKQMAHHLYEPVLTRERVAELASDPVPNRHATVHGLVSYRTVQSSLNALIMTEFMYRIIHALNAGALGRP